MQPLLRAWLIVTATAVALVASTPLAAPAAPGDACLGFGTTTPGGLGGEVYHVTTLADGGAGSLRDAVSSGGRVVVFAVAGDIDLAAHIFVEGAFVTIDGGSAPSPGITLRGGSLIIRGTRGAHDVIVEGLRIRDSSIDGIQIGYGAFNVVVSHVSVTQAFDGSIDIMDSSDLTVCHSVLANPAGHNMLLRGATRVTVHDSLFVGALTGSPNAIHDAGGTPAPVTTLDMRHNFVRDWGAGWGTAIHHGAAANVVENLFWSKNSEPGDQANALIVCRGDCGADPTSLARAYVAGNLSGDALGAAVNAEGTEPAPLPAPVIPSRHACTAARAVLDTAGAMPRDAIDTAYIGTLTMPRACIGDLIVSALTAPANAAPGATVTVEDTVTNRGPGIVPEPSVTTFYLSPTPGRDPAEVRLAQRPVPPLGDGESHTAATALVIPAAAGALGTYYIVAVADGDDVLPEALDDNNVRARRIVVGPDLIVDGVWAPDSAAPGDAIPVTVAVRNRGAGPIGPTSLRLFLATQPTLADAIPLYAHGVPGLAAGTTHTASVTTTIPDTAGTAGTYYIVAMADGAATTPELDEINNLRAARILIGPDLVIDVLTSPPVAVAGATIVVSDTVRNRGTGPVRPTTTRFYLSPAPTLDGRGVLIGTRPVGRLAPVETSTANTTLTIPAGTGAATPYFVIAVADATLSTGELDTSNNTRAARVMIGPDLVVDAVVVPASAAPGAIVQIGDTVRNRGVGPAAPFSVRYTCRPLRPSMTRPSRSGSGRCRVSPPARPKPGDRRDRPALRGHRGDVLHCRGRGRWRRHHGSQRDEQHARGALIIGPDLIVDGLAGPTAAAPGATMTMSRAVRNRGVGPAPPTTLRFHLSTQTTIGADAVALGERSSSPSCRRAPGRPERRHSGCPRRPAPWASDTSWRRPTRTGASARSSPPTTPAPSASVSALISPSMRSPPRPRWRPARRSPSRM